MQCDGTLAGPVGLHPQVANGIGYLAAVAVGYVTHSSFTFRGHGGRDNQAARGVRFVAVSLVSYALNALWVWLCVTHMQWPDCSPIPAMLLVRPALGFGLNGRGGFKSEAHTLKLRSLMRYRYAAFCLKTNTKT